MRKTTAFSCACACTFAAKAPSRAIEYIARAINRESRAPILRSLGVAARVKAGHGTISVAGSSLMMCVRYGPVMKGLGVAVDARFVFVIRGINVAVGADRAMVWQVAQVLGKFAAT